MGMSSFNCLVCGRDMMSELSYKGTPDWMKHVVVFMPDDVMIAGKYTGYLSVETGETIWSKYVDRKRHERQDRCEGISIIHIPGDQFFQGEKCDEDHGYLSMHMWEDNHLYAPCCYHRACWEAVGSPEGYRGPSIRSQDQGFGSMAKLYAPSNYGNWDDEDRDDGPYIGAPSPGPEATMLWAVNSICHFFYTLNSWCAAMEYAEEQREMWRSFERFDALKKDLDALVGNDDKEDPDNSGSGIRPD